MNLNPPHARRRRRTSRPRLLRQGSSIVSRLLSIAGFGLVVWMASCDGEAPALVPKIGLMTSTVSQGEDEYRGAERVIVEYGRERIIHTTYPDDFMKDQEVTVAKIRALADDPAVQVIIIAQAIPGCIKAIKDIKATRPEVQFILISPQEDPVQVASYADLLMVPDDLERGRTIAETAKKMGARTLIQYTFPRHMSIELLSRRRDFMSETCGKIGLEFITVNAPDPMGDQGIPGAQKFILEDVPRQLSLHGKSTAFFSTNCAMQEPLIRSVIEHGGLFPEQCCPSPTHGYPGALGIRISPGIAGNMELIRAEIGRAIQERGAGGRLGTWRVSSHIAMIEAAADLAMRHFETGADIKDAALVKEALEKRMGPDVRLRPYSTADQKTVLQNYQLALLDSEPF